ncbi:MAG TPA: 50S ribosomal protein L10 [Acidimicrobiales bacterium]|nr:50S ribosomal protein L10 [Acidimicrobiales bacterium]
MDNPRAEKVAVVDEVRERLQGSSASVVTEYRGLTVADLAELRRNLAAAGGDYKIFKNTLVRLAIAGSAHQPIQDLLTGPTGIAFVHGDVSAVAKALREFSRGNPNLVVKGGLIDGDVLTSGQLGALADLPSRDVLLARFAGLLQAPLAQLAGLLQALPRDLAYGLSALLDQKGGAPEDAAEASAEDVSAEAPAAAEAPVEAPAAEAPAEAPAAEASAEVPAAEAPAETEAETAEADADAADAPAVEADADATEE